MGPDKRKKKIIYFSTPRNIGKSYIQRLLEQEKDNLVKPTLYDMDWTIDSRKSKYPYGLGKEWEF